MAASKKKYSSTTDPQAQKPAAASAPTSEFRIPYPVLLLLAVVFVVYIPSLSLGFTELDDTIFIREFRAYNEDLANLVAAFGRGLFDAVKDPYYRPLFSDAMILNYHLSGVEPGGYHLVNVLLHAGAVLLFYRLLPRLGVRPLHAFLLALIFAVHPVLVQAVSWIPGRNDTLLAIFVFAFIGQAAAYADGGKTKALGLSGLFLLLAFFTKETAVFAGPAAFCLLVWYKGVTWNDRRMTTQYVVWAVCFGIWYGARAAATIQSSGIGSGAAFGDMMHRLPVVLQYLGKVVLPVNQSVFPIQQDTVLYYGIGAVILLGAATFAGLRKGGNEGVPKWQPVLASVAVFLLFLMPALLVPSALNQQVFEHRLYLPMAGILLLLPLTIVFRNALPAKTQTLAIAGVCGLLAVANVTHQAHFSDPLTFWTQAVETSPNSAYANMMLAARLDKAEAARSEALFRKAYQLNPKEKYLNFYMGEMLQKKDSVLASEPYLLEEKKISDYVLCDFYLARVAMERRDIPAAIKYLQTYLKRDPGNAMANNNLVLLYMDTNQRDMAKAHVTAMRQRGIPVPPALAQQVGL